MRLIGVCRTGIRKAVTDMARFARDAHEMTPADEWVYEAVVEAGAWGDHLATRAELARALPLDDAAIDASLAHLSDTIGLVEPVRTPSGETGYRTTAS